MSRHLAATAQILLAVSISGLLFVDRAMAGATVAGGQAAVGEWAFHPPVAHEPPGVSDVGWVVNPIDQFILNRLERDGLRPSAEAPRQALIRRAYLDLIGIPPSPTDVDAFVADHSADAFDKVVDRLLSSPQYGERWARHWLDLARYADSEGFKADETRPYAWHYRDYVIQSLNRDKPFDRFVREQLAGDELWPDDSNARVATGFLRHYPDESNARDLLQRRQEILNDVTDTVGATFLGLTVGCARCHDHKYDPIAQRDYYRLQAFFAGMRADDHILICSPAQIRQYKTQRAVWEQKTQSIRREMEKLLAPRRRAILSDYFDKYPAEIRAALQTPPEDRTPLDWVFHFKAAQYLGPDSYQYLAPDSTCAGGLKNEQRQRWEELKKELGQYDELKPADLPLGTGVTDAGLDAPKTYLLTRGVFNAFKEEVQPGFPTAVDSGAPRIIRPEGTGTTGRRAALANWIANAANPLTARVIVNRVWAWHFGRGIVASPSDFGVQGGGPSHPELLDWMALRFVRDGWSLKKLHRLIMTSSAYRQSTAPAAAQLAADPDDRLLWRFPRQRLEAEVVRDSALSVAGLLDPKMGGPGVFPPIPAGLEVRGGWPVTKDLRERNRRSIYVFVRRNVRYPMFEAFDMPNPYETCPRRFVTTTPSQALTLLNDKLTLDWARHLAGRVLAEAASNRAAIVDRACRLAYCRHASPEEQRAIGEFLDRQQAIVKDRLDRNEALALPVPANDGVPAAEAAAVVDLCHVLINSNEFVYSD